ncbi:MAG: PEGA domain-containing protein [Polyangiaceae bacterium]|nr:PEGA domain-containing protein [Polyangiaceae bacterium]
MTRIGWSGVARALALVALVLVALATPAPGSAQGRDATSERLEKIRLRMEKGQSLYLAKSYAAAAREFEEGYKEHPYSAFLFNAGVCYQKLDEVDKALTAFREYLRVDPSAPDADKVRARIAALEARKAATAPPPPPDGGTPAGDAGTATDAGTPEAGPPPPPPATPEDDEGAMKSLVVIETDPEGAPLRLYQRVQTGAAPFTVGGANPGWKEVGQHRAPVSLSLAVGKYHVVVERFRDFNVSETDIDVSPGHVHHFKANLSQGAFMAFLRVTANVRGAYVFLDEQAKLQKKEWGLTPYGQLVRAGRHPLRVEAPGFEPFESTVDLKNGQQAEVTVTLRRVSYGFLRVDANAAEVRVRLDEQPVGFWKSGTEPLMVRAKAGRHKLTITGDGRKTYEGEVFVPDGMVLPIRAKLIPKYPRGAAWTQAIIGGVVIGAATYFGIESNRLHTNLERDRDLGVLDEDDERITRGKLYAIGADAGFAVGGVLGLLSVYSFLKDPLPESTITQGKKREFDDPRKKRPAARQAPPRAVGARGLGRATRPREPSGVTPIVSGGLVGVGGTF